MPRTVPARTLLRHDARRASGGTLRRGTTHPIAANAVRETCRIAARARPRARPRAPAHPLERSPAMTQRNVNRTGGSYLRVRPRKDGRWARPSAPGGRHSPPLSSSRSPPSSCWQARPAPPSCCSGKSETPVVDQSPAQRTNPVAEAEASFTYAFVFGQSVAPRCGRAQVAALAAASEAEKASDPAMAALASQRAATRATNITTAKSCGRARYEVEAADQRARAAHQ